MNSEKISILDHGYVQLIESWGSDERIIEAARMSTNKGFQGWKGQVYFKCKSCEYKGEPFYCSAIPDREVFCPCCTVVSAMELYNVEKGDEKLLAYLYNHKHSTPFEMAGLTIEVQAPIFVFREWHRHRTQSYNEMSARYTPLPDLNYLPTFERLLQISKSNNQAKSTNEFNPSAASQWLEDLADFYRKSQNLYESGLSSGIPKEVARLCLPVARYSRMRASANLRNWLAFLTLRMDSHAQYEIRMYANQVGVLISELFPRTWELFAKEREDTK